MSVNRENVTWERADGTWANGYWDYIYVNADSPDFDSEWDVEYLTEFQSVYLGATPEEAMKKFLRSNANPGGTTVIENSPENAGEIKSHEETYSRWINRRPPMK